jgi:hypothetical protein
VEKAVENGESSRIIRKIREVSAPLVAIRLVQSGSRGLFLSGAGGIITRPYALSRIQERNSMASPADHIRFDHRSPRTSYGVGVRRAAARRARHRAERELAADLAVLINAGLIEPVAAESEGGELRLAPRDDGEQGSRSSARSGGWTVGTSSPQPERVGVPEWGHA